MARLFISYSSQDKPAACRIAGDLKELGHEVWLDEWEIRVGDCIVREIEQGVSEADFVVLLLSANAVQSGWVEREWRAKYFEEIEQKRIRVLPVLIERCEIPTLLKTKRYADLRDHYGAGFARLCAAISPSIDPRTEGLLSSPRALRLTSLIERIQSDAEPLSKSVAAVLAFATESGEQALAQTCSRELAGYPGGDCTVPPYRMISGYATASQINLEYLGFGGSPLTAMQAMARDRQHFAQQKVAVGWSVAEIEDWVTRVSRDRLFFLERRWGDVDLQANEPDRPIYFYTPSEALGSVVAGIRTEIAKKLISLLPG